jgi:hypothetical protein
VRPGHSRFVGSYGSSTSDYDTSQYKEDLKKFRKMALGGSGLQSSSAQTPTSEHGKNPSVSVSSSDGDGGAGGGGGAGEEREDRRQAAS